MTQLKGNSIGKPTLNNQTLFHWNGGGAQFS